MRILKSKLNSVILFDIKYSEKYNHMRDKAGNALSRFVRQ